MRYIRYTSLGFAETPLQWQALVAARGSSCPDLQIVAVTPEVDYLAICSGQPYLSIEDFYYWGHINKLGEENYDRTEEICDEVDNVIRWAMGKLPGSDLVTFGAMFHPIKGFLDNLTLRMVPVQAVFEYIQPCRVLCFPQPEYKVKGDNLLDKPSLSLTSRIVPLVAQARHCKIDWLVNNEADINSQKMFVPSPCTINEPALKKEELDGRIDILKSVLAGYQRSAQLFSDKQLLFSNAGADNFAAKILSSWQNHYEGVFFDLSVLYTGRFDVNSEVRGIILSEIGQFLWNAVSQNQTIRQILKTRDIDQYTLIYPQFYLLIKKELPRLLFWASIVDRNFKELKNAVVMTGGMMGVNRVIAKACDKFKIPMVTTHRGGYLGYCLMPFQERYVFADADYSLCGGLGAAQTFAEPPPMARWRLDRKRAKPVVTGSAWVDELVAQYRTEKRFSTKEITASQKLHKRRTIMYIMSAMLGDNCYLGYVFTPEIWLWRFQFELISFLSQFSGIDVVLKRPIFGRCPQITNPIYDWLETQNFKNIHIFPHDVQLEKIMDQADAFIVDSPSSPIWPLVASDKPFAAYIDRDFFRLVPQAAEMLKKRAVFADNREEFFEKLLAFLQKPDWTSDGPVNDEFLCHYGTYLNDGNSDKRVAQFLYQCATGAGSPMSGENYESCSSNSQYADR